MILPEGCSVFSDGEKAKEIQMRGGTSSELFRPGHGSAP